MNTTAEGREGVETALEGFCDSLPSGVYEESSHVKVFSLKSVLGSFLMITFVIQYGNGNALSYIVQILCVYSQHNDGVG